MTKTLLLSAVDLEEMRTNYLKRDELREMEIKGYTYKNIIKKSSVSSSIQRSGSYSF